MIFGHKEARIIERLREAASQNGEVYDLLVVLCDAVQIDDMGNKTLDGASDSDVRYLRIAQSALAFCEIDRGEGEDNKK